MYRCGVCPGLRLWLWLWLWLYTAYSGCGFLHGSECCGVIDMALHVAIMGSRLYWLLPSTLLAYLASPCSSLLNPLCLAGHPCAASQRQERIRFNFIHESCGCIPSHVYVISQPESVQNARVELAWIPPKLQSSSLTLTATLPVHWYMY